MDTFDSVPQVKNKGKPNNGQSHSAPVDDEPNSAELERLEMERNLAGALFMSDRQDALDVFNRYLFDPAMIVNVELREFCRAIIQDGKDPNVLAFDMGLERAYHEYYKDVPNAYTYLPMYVHKITELFNQRQKLELLQVMAAGVLENNPERFKQGLEALQVQAGGFQGKGKLLSEPTDHDGHANALLSLYPGKFLYTDQTGWLTYTGKHWRMDGAERELEAAITDTLRQRRVLAAAYGKEDLIRAAKITNSTVTGVKALLAHKVQASLGEFDNNADLLNVNNGVVNLRTMKLTPHDHTQRFTYVVPVDYEPDADHEPWLKFLLAAVDHPNVVEYLQLAVGYSFTGYTSDEVMFYLQGPPRAGKGTFIETLRAVMGGRPLFTEASFETFARSERDNSQNFDLAPLKPARFVAASESEDGQRLNPARIKRMTGGNDLYCAFKGRDMFNYRPQFKIWLSSNHPVSTDVDDDAAWGRVRLVEFPHSHLGDEDTRLKEQLKKPANLRGVLAWVIEGAHLWFEVYHNQGKTLPATSEMEAVLNRTRLAQDYIAQFLAENYETAPGSYELYSVVYGSYDAWCKENGAEAKGRKKFTEALRTRGFITDQKKVNGKNDRYVFGLKRLG